MREPRALRKARLYWANGQPLPVDLYFQLTNLGFDVEVLQAHYCV